MSYLLQSMVQEGDEVIYPNPGFPIYESMIEFLGAKAVALPLLEKKGFGFDAATVEGLITPATKNGNALRTIALMRPFAVIARTWPLRVSRSRMVSAKFSKTS